MFCFLAYYLNLILHISLLLLLVSVIITAYITYIIMKSEVDLSIFIWIPYRIAETRNPMNDLERWGMRMPINPAFDLILIG